MIELTKEELEIVETVATVSTITELDRAVRSNKVILNDLLDRFYTDPIVEETKIESTGVDSKINNMWHMANHLSERACEFLDYETEAYDLCRKLKEVNK